MIPAMGMRAQFSQVGLSDEALVLASREGDREAMATLLGRHRAVVVGLCRRILLSPHAAEDAAQEACLQALLNLDRLRNPERFGPWLAGIGLNLCRRWLRDRAAHVWSWDALEGGRWEPEPVDRGPTPEETAQAAETTKLVRRAVAHLPRGQREAVTLYYLAGMTQQEVGDALGTTGGAVKTRLHKARLRLRDRLVDLWKEEDVGASAETEWIEMGVADVRRARAAGRVPERYVVLLQEEGGERGLPIWVGPFEGTALAMILEGAELPRPQTYTFAANLLRAVGGRLREVRIARLADITYYAEAILEGSEGTATVDARPSDAIAVALLSGVPVTVNSSILPSPEEQESLEEFQREREEYAVGAGDIARERKSAWERDMEEFRETHP